MRTHVETISVRYAETDRMGVAHHSSYLLWFEIGRTGLLRAAGHPYKELEASGVLLPVIEYGARFMLGADYADVLAIETTVREIRSRVVTFDYVARRGADIIATGFTRHACMDQSKRARRFPAGLLAAIEPFRR
jgi:acyl-CoA thioester hydrolase